MTRKRKVCVSMTTRITILLITLIVCSNPLSAETEWNYYHHSCDLDFKYPAFFNKVITATEFCIGSPPVGGGILDSTRAREYRELWISKNHLMWILFKRYEETVDRTFDCGFIRIFSDPDSLSLGECADKVHENFNRAYTERYIVCDTLEVQDGNAIRVLYYGRKDAAYPLFTSYILRKDKYVFHIMMQEKEYSEYSEGYTPFFYLTEDIIIEMIESIVLD